MLGPGPRYKDRLYSDLPPPPMEESDISWRGVGDAIPEPWAEARTQTVL